MSNDSEWSPGQDAGAGSREPGDEAFDEEVRLDPGFLEAVEEDPSLDPSQHIDELELEEAGIVLDDPESLDRSDTD